MVEIRIEDINDLDEDDLFDSDIAIVEDGIVRCPAGFALRKMDDNVWRCDGGHHEFKIDEGEIEYDKYGNILLKCNPDDTEKEMKEKQK